MKVGRDVALGIVFGACLLTKVSLMTLGILLLLFLMGGKWVPRLAKWLVARERKDGEDGDARSHPKCPLQRGRTCCRRRWH